MFQGKDKFGRLLLSLALVSGMASCAHNSKSDQTGSSIATATPETPKKKQPVHRIVGSASIKQDSKFEGKSYFLYGAEHLKLDNYYFDIPVVYNDSVKMWMNYFLEEKGRGFFERYAARAGRYAPILGKILEDNGLPRDLIFLAMAESGFQTNAKSWARAVGPWQFMPSTGRIYGLKIDWYVDERQDPIKATIAAAQYLQKLYQDFGAWELAAAAYNAGEGKVSRAIQRYKTENFWSISEGRFLKSETRNYVPKIMALAIIGKNLKSFGFEDIDFHDPLDFEEIKVPPMTDLVLLSEKLGVDFDEMQRLNPELLRWFTPPNVDSYNLRVPVNYRLVWETCCQHSDYKATAFQKFEVKNRSVNIKDLSHKFKIKPYVLTALNDFGGRENLEKGTIVLLPFREGQSNRSEMYADLYELPRRSVLQKRAWKKQLGMAVNRGKRINNPSGYYTVKKGDTLWDVAKKSGISLDTLIASNYDLVKYRRIRAGDKLVVR